MAKEEPIELTGSVTQVLPGTMFRVALPNGHEVLAHISGKMRKNFIRISVATRSTSKCRPTIWARRGSRSGTLSGDASRAEGSPLLSGDHLSLDFTIGDSNLSAMRIHFLGATRTTTGSVYLFELNGQRLLLECGLFQGRRGDSIERNRNFPFDPDANQCGRPQPRAY